MRLSDSYSARHTISGEMCYMVDQQLYKDILLPVAAKKQNEKVYVQSVQLLENHMGRIESSHGRAVGREGAAIDEFAQTLKIHSECPL